MVNPLKIAIPTERPITRLSGRIGKPYAVRKDLSRWPSKCRQRAFTGYWSSQDVPQSVPLLLHQFDTAIERASVLGAVRGDGRIGTVAEGLESGGSHAILR